ncbi:ABC-type Fe3+/spermidine/putrescine transport system ATPase subunit [Deinobacterium chartae]|uniref:ABC-type Fe3+/spermidine/putrescine transport system ATPase subunit n=1 Tax=Deinobacterium chartae TaxID=521158 RepID=A0A841HYV7_9DEIO|nr:ABC transporter ATP-binding protein [Deinobacterium chartae]MBB6097138.1 ABC-type Fe3+/spermidine/putrescine transport system ATPase subunit [Deinobacterium chartae]
MTELRTKHDSLPPTSGAEAHLEVRELVKRFGAVTALREVSLQAARGEVVALLGPSGCGKSTLLRSVAGLERTDAGTLRLAGRDLRGVPPERREVGMVFQDYALFPHLNVLGNVAYGPRERGLPRLEAERQARAALERVGLPGLETRRSFELSGGQQQRVALARALAVKPQLLLLDEPFSNLDEPLRVRLQAELQPLLRELEITTLLVTHDQREAFALADRVAVLREGQVVQIGTPRAVYARPADAWTARFLGHANVLSENGQTRLFPDTALRLEAGGAPARLERLLFRGRGARLELAQGERRWQLELSARELADLEARLGTLETGRELPLAVDHTQALLLPERA